MMHDAYENKIKFFYIKSWNSFLNATVCFLFNVLLNFGRQTWFKNQ